MNTIYVGNLIPEVDKNNLIAIFSDYGSVSSARIIKNGNVSRCYGFVEMENEEEALIAIKKLNGARYCNKNLHVKMATGKKSERSQIIDSIKKIKEKDKEYLKWKNNSMKKDDKYNL